MIGTPSHDVLGRYIDLTLHPSLYLAIQINNITAPPLCPMLLRDFVNQLDGECPLLSATLTVHDFVRFATLAAKVQEVAGKSLRLTSTRTTVLPFLVSALSPEYPPHLMPDLWRLAFPHLPGIHIDASAAIRDFGMQPVLDSTSKLPERFLRAPLAQCIVCPERSNLHVHTRLDGYLYDTDGTHAIQTVILCCSSKINLLILS